MTSPIPNNNQFVAPLRSSIENYFTREADGKVDMVASDGNHYCCEPYDRSTGLLSNLRQAQSLAEASSSQDIVAEFYPHSSTRSLGRVIVHFEDPTNADSPMRITRVSPVEAPHVYDSSHSLKERCIQRLRGISTEQLSMLPRSLADQIRGSVPPHDYLSSTSEF